MYEHFPMTSPAGHPIAQVEGEVGAIRTRGESLKQLAIDMNHSSTLLQRLVENGAEMKGDSIDKLKEVSEEMYKELGRAADLYEVVAPHILTYAKELESAKSAIAPILDDLVDLWTTYQQKQGDAYDAAGRRPAYPTGEDGDDEQARKDAEDARDKAAADAADQASDARDAWDARAGDYDREWDSWYEAFSNAASGIREDTSDKIKDDFWDNVDGFLQFMSDFLAVAGIVLAVLAVIVGGPIIAALAAIVAIATLLVAVGRLIRGNGSVLDVVFGVIGVLPLVGPAIRMFRGPAAELAQMGLSKAHFVDYVADIRLNPRNLVQLHGGPTQVISDATALFFTGKTATTPLAAVDTITEGLEAAATPFAAMFSIAGGIKDSAGGAWSGMFDPDQNIFS